MMIIGINKFSYTRLLIAILMVSSSTLLFAKKIEFVHPTTKEKMTFELDLPNRKPFNIF